MPASLLHREDGVRGPGCAGLEGRLNLRSIVAVMPVALWVRITWSHQKGILDALRVRGGGGGGIKKSEDRAASLDMEQPHC